jgi:hypothetical protein
MAKGALLTEQGEPGHAIYLLLDGVLSVWVDGSELGPGAVVGERTLLEDGRRTAILRAITDCVIAAAAAHRSTVAPWAALPSSITGKTQTGEPGRGGWCALP